MNQLKPFFLITLLIISLSSFGQVSSDTIQVVKKGGTSYLMNGKKLTPKQMLEITKPYAEAYNQMKKAKSTYGFANVLGFVGGFMVGWPLGSAIGGGDPNWALAGIGAGILLISIPVYSSYNKQAKEAVKLYNAAIGQTGLIPQLQLNLQKTENGLGMVLKF